jgi:hypothetical protein
MRQKILAFIIFSVITSLSAWSPWITQDRALKLAEIQFNRAWNAVIDGCGTSGNDLGAKDFRKVPFGAYVTLDYQCGLVMPNEPALHTNVLDFIGIKEKRPEGWRSASILAEKKPSGRCTHIISDKVYLFHFWELPSGILNPSRNEAMAVRL